MIGRAGRAPQVEPGGIARLVHLVGRSEAAKTRAVVALVEALGRRGLRVGTIKRSGHAHALDPPGKVTHLHRQAGASPAAIATPDLVVAFLPRAPGADVYGLLAPLYADCDLVLVQGDVDGPGVKLEVWEASSGEQPLAAARGDIAAVVADDSDDSDHADDPIRGVAAPVWPLDELEALTDGVLGLVGLGTRNL